MVKTDQPILLVEDSPSDYELAVRGLRAGGLANPIYHCEDGDDALDFLYQRGRYEPATAPRPGVILLDLNLPGTDGREVLSVVKKDPVLRVIPVIVLTTSAHHRDIQECCRAGANSYMTKPVDLDAYLKALRLLTGYWFEITVLPRTS